jgi:MEMO1 family protein
VVPHAGYVYSGPVAASGYAALGEAASEQIRRVVLVGPSHFVPLTGLAVSGADAFETPLGLVPVDDETRRELLSLPECAEADGPHAMEHSLEVQLPFLQTVLRSFTLVPLAVSHADTAEVAKAIEHVWGGPETLVVVSTDLSHHLDHETAMKRDRRTADVVLSGRPEDIEDQAACGVNALRGLMAVASTHGMKAELLDLRTSADTAGPADRVVGYGAFVYR